MLFSSVATCLAAPLVCLSCESCSHMDKVQWLKLVSLFSKLGFHLQKASMCVRFSLYHWIPPWLNWHANHLCISSLSLSLFHPFCANWVQVLSSMLQKAISCVQVPVSVRISLHVAQRILATNWLRWCYRARIFRELIWLEICSSRLGVIVLLYSSLMDYHEDDPSTDTEWVLSL